MSIFLIFAYLFFIGSIFGWILELFFRKFFSASNPQHRWINPGFCTGPYLPIYGFGLCTLYAISIFSENHQLPAWALIVLIVICMTLIEYIAGLICLKAFKLRLWDYSGVWGNIQGLICPLFSFFWGILGVVYYFFVHPRIISALQWLSENLAFSFVIGFFFGVFTLDVIHSANLIVRIKKVLDDKKIIVYLENVKNMIHHFNIENQFKVHFLRFFRTEVDFIELIEKIYKGHLK